MQELPDIFDPLPLQSTYLLSETSFHCYLREEVKKDGMTDDGKIVLFWKYANFGRAFVANISMLVLLTIWWNPFWEFWPQ